MIRQLAEQLNAHRTTQKAKHREPTLTAMYNVLEKLRSGESLTAKEKVIHEQGLISVLKQIHDELDIVVLDAYSWNDLAPLMQIVNGNAAPGVDGTPATREEAEQKLDESMLERLVALNAERAAEEQRGLVRWLRPEFQNPAGRFRRRKTRSSDGRRNWPNRRALSMPRSKRRACRYPSKNSQPDSRAPGSTNWSSYW